MRASRACFAEPVRAAPARVGRGGERRAALRRSGVSNERKPTLVEGPPVQPDLIPAGDRAVFLIPTPEFQRRVLEPRLMPSSDPVLALKHRLVKDRIYADRIAERARALGIEREPIDLVAARPAVPSVCS